jgi:hypothetical protein
MTNRDGGFRGFFNFEAFWQSRKKWEGIPWETSVQWWRCIDAPKRRYPKGKTVEWAQSEESDERIDYITSRKKIYVPLYHEYVVDTPSIEKWKELAATQDIVVYGSGGRKSLFFIFGMRVTCAFPFLSGCPVRRQTFGHGTNRER